MPDLTPEQQQTLVTLLIAVFQQRPWLVWVLLVLAGLSFVFFVIGVSSDMIDGDKLTSVRGKAHYRIARRFGLLFRGLGKDLYEAATGKEALP